MSPTPFKTFDVWDKTEGFKEVVKNYWVPSMHSCSSLEMAKEKLKRLKRD